MESEYYEIKIGISNYITHKSCKFDSGYFSNAKYILKKCGITELEKRCELVDKITENINLPFIYSSGTGRPKEFISLPSHATHYFTYYKDGTYKEFSNYDELYEYISQNEPNLIINHDIKIAIKD